MPAANVTSTLLISHQTDVDTPTPYPRLSAAQMQRVLAELAQEYRLDNLRLMRKAPVGTKAEQLELF
jgi:hypothetical protein